MRVPRSQLLQGIISVDRDGTFNLNSDPRVLYSTMLRTRAFIIHACPLHILACSTIVIRYSIVRRQFRNISGKKEETQLIDYQTQHMKIFPELAKAFVFANAANYMNDLLQVTLKQIENGEFKKLDLMHHLTSALKAVQTQDSYEGTERLRQSIGGAGYSGWAGLAGEIHLFSPCITFEGDNTVMAHQAYNYLSKQAKYVLKGEHEKLATDPVTAYLKGINSCGDRKCKISSIDQLMDVETVLEVLETKSLLQLRRLVSL